MTVGWGAGRSCGRRLSNANGEVEARNVLAFALAIGRHFVTAEHAEFGRTQAVNLAVALLMPP